MITSSISRGRGGILDSRHDARNATIPGLLLALVEQVAVAHTGKVRA